MILTKFLNRYPPKTNHKFFTLSRPNNPSSSRAMFPSRTLISNKTNQSPSRSLKLMKLWSILSLKSRLSLWKLLSHKKIYREQMEMQAKMGKQGRKYLIYDDHCKYIIIFISYFLMLYCVYIYRSTNQFMYILICL